MAMQTTRRAALLGSAAAAASTVIGSGKTWAQSEKPVRIGFAMPRSGLMANFTNPQRHAYDLWREQVNATGGLNVGGTKRPIEFVSYDDQSRPDQTVRIYEKLITDDKVDLLIAPWGTPFHIAVAPVLEKYKFPMVGNTAASSLLSQMKPGYIWFPTAAFPDRIAVELTALLQKQNGKSAVVLSNSLPYTKEIKNFLEPELKKAKVDIKMSTDYPPDIKDMTAMLSQAKQANADAIFALTYPNDSVLYARQAKELGLTAQFQFLAIGPTEPSFVKSIGATAADGIITIAQWSPRPAWKGSEEFFNSYIKRFGEEPDFLTSTLPWISLQILEAAVAKDGLDKEKLRATISNNTFRTINGDIRFEGVRNAITPTSLAQFQNGQLKIIWPASNATASFEPKRGW